MSNGQVPREITKPGKTQRALHVSEMEGEGYNNTVGNSAFLTVWPLWDACAGDAVGDTQEDIHM